MSRFAAVARAAELTLRAWDLTEAVSAKEIGRAAAAGVVHWEHSLPNGWLSLVRLHSPVVQREEVFLGNVLLNEFLATTFAHAFDREGERLAFLANDLENFYFLYHGRRSASDLADGFWHAFVATLPDLYLGDEDLSRGMYGNIRQMLTFYRSNQEPFPVFAIPRSLLPGLLRNVNARLRELLADDGADLKVIFAILAFFYARNGMEMQSPFEFLQRRMAESTIPADRIKAAFVVTSGDDLDKATFKERIKGQAVDRHALRQAVGHFEPYWI